MTELQLSEYFKSEKNDWFVIDAGTIARWDEIKVKEFWSLVREYKINKNDFNFDEFIFPDFEERDLHYIALFDNNFWFKGQIKVFTEDLSFRYSKFLGSCHFFNIKFQGNVVFKDCEFDGRTYFQRCDFEKRLYIKRVIFNRRLYIKACVVKEDLSLIHINFKAATFIEKLKIKKQFDIYWCVFNLIKLKNIKVRKLYMRWLVFKATSTIYYLKFEQFNLEFINSKHESNFENYYLPPNITFNGIYNNTTFFTDINLKRSVFINSDLSKIIFNKCIWSIKKGRLILFGENNILQDSIEHYRQLKSSFQKSQDWELAGYSYSSEMEIRKKIFFNQRRYLHWFFYWFYGFFSGYTQNYIRSLISILWVNVFFSIIFFFIDFNILNAIDRSINGSFPFFKSNIENLYPDKWMFLRNIEIMLSGIFISFFILSLRKRFKE